MKEAADARIAQSTKERLPLSTLKLELEDKVREIERQARKTAGLPVNDIEINTSRVRKREGGQVKFLEMLCILENAIVDLEGKENPESKEQEAKLSELRNSLLEKREYINVLVD